MHDSNNKPSLATVVAVIPSKKRAQSAEGEKPKVTTTHHTETGRDVLPTYKDSVRSAVGEAPPTAPTVVYPKEINIMSITTGDHAANEDGGDKKADTTKYNREHSSRKSWSSVIPESKKGTWICFISLGIVVAVTIALGGACAKGRCQTDPQPLPTTTLFTPPPAPSTPQPSSINTAPPALQQNQDTGTHEVIIEVHHDPYPEETGWTLRDSTGALIGSQPTGSFGAENGTVIKAFYVSAGMYSFEMTDTYGDGICCFYGSGSFKITVNGETVVNSKGEFRSIFQETFKVPKFVPSGFFAFENREQLVEAVDMYLVDSNVGTLVARSYGWPIGVWDVSKIRDFSEVFSADTSGNAMRVNSEAATFNEDISGWDVSSATTMHAMFAGALYFNQPLGNWDVSSVTEMVGMFANAESFDQSLDDWDVSSVADMSSMFTRAVSFDQPLGNWDVSSVTEMSYMFYAAEGFDQPLADWNVSGVTSMGAMFAFAYSFNQPLADWDVSSVTDMSSMFYAAVSFDQPLGDWDISSVSTDLTTIFPVSGCPGKAGQQSCF
jgi:surface protein